MKALSLKASLCLTLALSATTAFATPIQDFVKSTLANYDRWITVGNSVIALEAESEKLKEERNQNPPPDRLTVIDATLAGLEAELPKLRSEKENLEGSTYLHPFESRALVAGLSPVNYKGCSFELIPSPNPLIFTVRATLANGRTHSVEVIPFSGASSNQKGQVELTSDGKRFVRLYSFVTAKVVGAARYETSWALDFNEDGTLRKLTFSLDQSPFDAALNSSSCK